MVMKLHFGDSLVSESGMYTVLCKPSIDNVKKRYIVIVDGCIKSKRRRVQSVVSNLNDYGCDESMIYVPQGAISEARRLFSGDTQYLGFSPSIDFVPKDSSLYSLASTLPPIVLKQRYMFDGLAKYISAFKFFVRERQTQWIKRSLQT